MRRFGAFDVPYKGQKRYADEVSEGGIELEDGTRQPRSFGTETGYLEFWSPDIEAWGFEGRQALPNYITQPGAPRRNLDRGRRRDRVLLPTFRLPDADPHALGQREVAAGDQRTRTPCG